MSGSECREASYILPIRATSTAHVSDLANYLNGLRHVQLIVVDASEESIFAAHAAAFAPGIRHLRPDSDIEGANGKVRGVLTALRRCSHDKIVIADDDVRYTQWSLRAVIDALDDADIVRPQNYFDPLPWHAVLDTSRTLINRALDGDWPGTLAFRRRFAPFGYNPDALFENLELVRTVRARGGSEAVRRDIYVRRLPPATPHYLRQRVRQAYDEFARPLRLLTALSIVPLCIVRPSLAVVFSTLAIVTAFVGLMRANGYRYFSWLAVTAAPVWVAERAICAWLALYERARFGGVRYAGRIVKHAASSPKELRRKWAV
ncbi:MAG: glycosyltransferase family 2 protein [Candidatus Eremiobacteraeota bacterium]|nr:glycosyltransferase family 2 protein [Candidatus Eremiobacteraeota bacterium]